MSDPLTIYMQSRPEPFGSCYECADGDHERCIGVPCSCPCEWPKRDAPTPAEIDAAWTAHVNRQHPVLLEFVAACRGTGAPGEPTPLDALDSLLAEVRSLLWSLGREHGLLNDEIRTAWEGLLAPTERLARELRAAVAQVGGEEA